MTAVYTAIIDLGISAYTNTPALLTSTTAAGWSPFYAHTRAQNFIIPRLVDSSKSSF